MQIEALAYVHDWGAAGGRETFALNPEQQQRQDKWRISQARHAPGRACQFRARRHHKSSGARDARLPSRRTTTGAGELKTVALVIMFLTAHV